MLSGSRYGFCMIKLYDYQLDAVNRMKNGCILCGGVGSGKSITAIAYYYLIFGGQVNTENYVKMKNPMDLYIITTARKRDELEWEKELVPFFLSNNPEVNIYKNKVVIDSWNNIAKYKDVTDSFFIFDEQRVVGRGAWVKSFLKIAKFNPWILLSATPGDTWQDYVPVFIANGFFRNRTEFEREHIVFSRFSKYPKVDRYLNDRRLIRLRDSILINMDYTRPTVSHHETKIMDYDILSYKALMKTRWDPWENAPIENAGKLCFLLRKIVNSDESRQVALLELMEEHHKVIVFYNYDYELDILRSLAYPDGTVKAEWNGHVHQPIPKSTRWVYLVNYTSGCEGWNCIKTDTIIFFSENYSYRVMVQAAGRIDRLNTPFTDLYYYHFRSNASIDISINRALKNKKKFNERKFTEKL